METEHRNLTEEEIEKAWAKAEPYLESKHKNAQEELRKDYAGALIRRNEYGKQTDFGWEVDHLKPLSKGGTYDEGNLYPSHWKNNRRKSDNYPNWETEVTSQGDKNIEKVQHWTVKKSDAK